MAYRQKFNPRFSGRFNKPGQFVSGGEAFSQRSDDQSAQDETTETNDDDMNAESDSVSVSQVSEDEFKRPFWMKSKLAGVRKVTNRERRRRQNESLRRLLTPKNALMVLNEMMPNEQVTNQFKVEPAINTQYNSFKPNMHSFCADLTLEGQVYKGFGENKMMARNAAAEQAIRDLIIKKMQKAINSDTGSVTENDESMDQDTLPMIQLASFALHKLFSEWEYEGHKVPQLKPTPNAAPEAEPVVKKKVKELPEGASSMHPCVLLTYMRPHLEYRELAAEGDRPQNMQFTMAVDVDGVTYIGKAQNKKEARKAAARAACAALFAACAPPAPAQ